MFFEIFGQSRRGMRNPQTRSGVYPVRGSELCERAKLRSNLLASRIWEAGPRALCMGLAPGRKMHMKRHFPASGPAPFPPQVRVVHVCGCSLAPDHIFGSIRATFFRIYYRILLCLTKSWARRAGSGPGSGRELAGEFPSCRTVGLRKVAKKGGKCPEVRAGALNLPVLLKWGKCGAPAQGGFPKGKIQKQYFWATHLKNEFCCVKTIFSA